MSLCIHYSYSQLADLMSALHKAQPHYVRCIKPNPANQAGVFDQLYVLNQLQCGGVMEAVRISCAVRVCDDDSAALY